MGLRFVPAPPVPGALRSLATCLVVCAALGCAGGKSGPTGTGGSSATGSAGKTGSGGTTGSGSAGTTGSGSAGTTGSGAAGTTGSGSAGTTGSGSAGTTGSGSAGTTGHAGTTGTGAAGTTGTGAAGTTGSGVDASVSDAACQSASYTFAPKIPTVLILVDRSGSEFTNATTGTFFTLRTAVETVVAQLDSQVRFGVASFVGDHASGSCALNYQSVAIGLNNSAAIKAAYDGWGPLLPYGSTADTPAVEAIPMAKAALQADTGTGQKYLMIVTDSETDFCDNGNALCPADAVTYQIQDMFAATPSIGTLVIGLPTSLSNISASVLQNFANAGAGQPVALPTGIATTADVTTQCNGQGTAAGSDSWSNLRTAAGRTGSLPLATYSATGGTATVFAPTSTSQTALQNQISAAISGVKSCTFDLSDVGGRSIKVDTTKLAQAKVKIQGTTVPLDATNGWNVSASAPSQLVLSGTACTNWRMPNNTLIDFAFPCSTIIFE